MRSPFAKTLSKTALGCALSLFGCATASSTPATTSTSSGSGGQGGQGGAGGAVSTAIACSAGMPCPSGSTCGNGVCSVGCNVDGDCSPSQYCALFNGQICQEKTTLGCPASPCAPTQVCVEGLCGTVPTGNPCGPSPFGGSDGCSPDSLCLKDVVVDGEAKADPTCYTTPPCDAEHACSPGGDGALCNDGIIMNKDKTCIPNACQTEANCPESWRCISGTMGEGYGHCTDGAAGHVCGKSSDCHDGLQCHTPIANKLGTCK